MCVYIYIYIYNIKCNNITYFKHCTRSFIDEQIYLQARISCTNIPTCIQIFKQSSRNNV